MTPLLRSVSKGTRGQSSNDSRQATNAYDPPDTPVITFYQNIFEDVSREFDEFRVNTHLSLQAALLVPAIYYMGEFLLNGRGPMRTY